MEDSCVAKVRDTHRTSLQSPVKDPLKGKAFMMWAVLTLFFALFLLANLANGALPIEKFR